MKWDIRAIVFVALVISFRLDLWRGARELTGEERLHQTRTNKLGRLVQLNFLLWHPKTTRSQPVKLDEYDSLTSRSSRTPRSR